MPLLEVGQRYHPNGSTWPEGLHVFGLSAQRMEVMVALGGITDAAAAAFRDTTRPFEVGLASHARQRRHPAGQNAGRDGLE